MADIKTKFQRIRQARDNGATAYAQTDQETGKAKVSEFAKVPDRQMKMDKESVRQRRNSVPGMVSDADANMFNPDYPEKQTPEQNDVNVLIKLSALKKLKAAAGQR